MCCMSSIAPVHRAEGHIAQVSIDIRVECFHLMNMGADTQKPTKWVFFQSRKAK